MGGIKIKLLTIITGTSVSISLVSISLVFLLVLFLSGCGSSSRTGGDFPAGNENATPVNFSDYEDFDPNQFPDELVDERSELVHDVPAELLENRADAGVAQIVAGYRIQTFASVDRDVALAAEEDVKLWLEKLTDEVRLEFEIPERLPVYNQFKQPLYRVRLGDFTNRAEAERVMMAMARSFQRVFVVPDDVTVYR